MEKVPMTFQPKNEVVENFSLSDVGDDIRKIIRWIVIAVIVLIVGYLIVKLMRSRGDDDGDDVSMSFSPKKQNFGFRFY